MFIVYWTAESGNTHTFLVYENEWTHRRSDGLPLPINCSIRMLPGTVTL